MTVSQTTVFIEPMKMFRLEHETMRACQTNVARFDHVVCRCNSFRFVFSLEQRKDALKVNKFGQTYRIGAALDEYTANTIDLRRLWTRDFFFSPLHGPLVLVCGLILITWYYSSNIFVALRFRKYSHGRESIRHSSKGKMSTVQLKIFTEIAVKTPEVRTSFLSFRLCCLLFTAMGRTKNSTRDQYF